MGRRSGTLWFAVGLVLMAAGCSQQGPTAPLAVEGAGGTPTLAPAGTPATPPFNLEAVLRDVSGGPGFGLVKFRQPSDADLIVYLDTWVRALSPDTSYLLQRAVDTAVDGNCASAAWLTLGKGLAPEAIVTDASGTGRAELFRLLPDSTQGTRFDIHFRVIESATSVVALQSACYEFVSTR